MAPGAPLQVRPYRPADADRVIALAVEMADEIAERPPALDPAVLARATEASGPWCELLVAVEAGEAGDGDILGFAVCTRRFEAHMGRFSLWIADLHVAASARRRGVGRALMAAIGRRAIEAGCALVAWDLWVENEPARRFYAALGAQFDSQLEVLHIQPERLLGD